MFHLVILEGDVNQCQWSQIRGNFEARKRAGTLTVNVLFSFFVHHHSLCIIACVYGATRGGSRSKGRRALTAEPASMNAAVYLGGGSRCKT